MTRIAVPNSRGLRRKGGAARWLLIFVLVIVGGAALWTWLTLSWAYADGERAGVLQKFVKRGWLCKTSEGEIALYYGGGQYLGPSSSPQLWDFSVRSNEVGAQLTKAVGHRVQLHYTEHPGIPTRCFAETRFFVDRVTVTDADSPGAPTAPAPASPAPGDAQPGPAARPPGASNAAPAPASPGTAEPSAVSPPGV